MKEIGLLGAIIVVFLTIISAINQLRANIAHLNTKLDKIAMHIGMPDPTIEIEKELKELLSEGSTIEAVKRYRELTGLGLKEAKDYVDTLNEEL